MPVNKIIRLLPEGPEGTGLAPMEIDPSDFEQVPTEQRIHVFYEDDAKTFAVGIWTTTDMKEAFGPYPGDEVMVVLEGRVDMRDAAGGVTAVEQGQAFGVRNGVPLSWEQTGFLRKAFLLMSNGGETEGADGQGVFVLSPDEGAVPLTETGKEIGGGHQRDAVLYRNDAGNLEAGIWETTAFETEPAAYAVHELAHVLSGEVTLSEADGAEHHFVAGDTFFVPAGTVCSWRTDGALRTYFAILAP